MRKNERGLSSVLCTPASWGEEEKWRCKRFAQRNRRNFARKDEGKIPTLTLTIQGFHRLENGVTTPLATRAMKISFSRNQGNGIMSGNPVLGVLGKAAPGVAQFVGAHFECLTNRPK